MKHHRTTDIQFLEKPESRILRKKTQIHIILRTPAEIFISGIVDNASLE